MVGHSTHNAEANIKQLSNIVIYETQMTIYVTYAMYVFIQFPTSFCNSLYLIADLRPLTIRASISSLSKRLEREEIIYKNLIDLPIGKTIHWSNTFCVWSGRRHHLIYVFVAAVAVLADWRPGLVDCWCRTSRIPLHRHAPIRMCKTVLGGLFSSFIWVKLFRFAFWLYLSIN